MKQLTILCVLVALAASAQTISLGSIRVNATLDDPTAKVEPLTIQELAKLDAAKKVVEEAQANLGKVMRDIEKAHGDQSPGVTFPWQACGYSDYDQVDIVGKYALKVRRKGTSCFVAN